jgi:single-stranded DNA-binding protein
MNHVVLSGTLDSNPDSLGHEQGALFTLRPREPRPGVRSDRIRIVCWNELARIVLKYLARGDEIALVGKLRPNEWTYDRNGQPAVEIVVEEIEFLKVRAGSSGQGGGFSPRA